MLQADKTATPSGSRVRVVDVARGVALLAMAIYHFTWDIEFFHYLPLGTTAEGGWRLFARSIASSFLFLVGVSLVLATVNGLRAGPFLRRLGMVAAAAAAISLVTYLAMPGGFIFFGILHQIALASIVGLLFVRLPWPLTLLAAVAAIAAPHFLRSAAFDHPALWWVGLSSSDPISNDYVPMFPWIGAVLTGIAAARLAVGTGIMARLGAIQPGLWSRPFETAGRHSLLVYLVHQPVLIACVWAFAQFWPAAASAPAPRFIAACEQSCADTRDAAFCVAYCGCVLDELEAGDRLDAAFSSVQDAETRQVLQDLAAMCTYQTELAVPGEGSVEE